MNRFSRLASLTRAVVSPWATAAIAETETKVFPSATRAWWVASHGFATAPTASTDEEVGHITGFEKQELELSAHGVDPWHEEWLDAPWGTEDSPVQVTSTVAERIVGVPDPDDDSLVWWGVVKDGEPPKQIIEGGEFFVLKKIEGGGGHH